MIREATADDFEFIWPLFKSIIDLGTTYVYPPGTTKDDAFHIWFELPVKTYVFLSSDNRILGSYYIKENRPGLGSHVCRCGYLVNPDARRQGIGEAMCRHSLAEALDLGFRSMQLGYVVSTNTASVNLWLKMGFEKVGVVPKAFFHHELSDYVDVFIMYKSLVD